VTTTSTTGISVAVPNKGRLSDQTVELFRRAGLAIELGSSRQLFARAWDGRVRVLFVRAQDIPGLVADGRVDLGVTGLDLVLESAAPVKRLLDLRFGACRLVLAVPEKSGVRSLRGLPREVAVATSFPNLTRAFLRRKGKRAKIIAVSGATEVMPHLGVADAITDLTATGSTLAMNELVEVASLLRSTAWLIAHPAALRNGKRPLVDDVRFALESVVEARAQRYLMMDVPTSALDAVRRIVPGIAGPTVMDIYGDSKMKAVHVVVDEDHVYEVMRKLKLVGARGILVVPIDRMVS
jgi:ATP phosphoribosyltransferase